MVLFLGVEEIVWITARKRLILASEATIANIKRPGTGSNHCDRDSACVGTTSTTRLVKVARIQERTIAFCQEGRIEGSAVSLGF